MLRVNHLIGFGKKAASVAPLAIAGTPVLTATEDAAYDGFTVSATGGTPPYTFSVLSGAFPAGITLNSSTGAVSGTPTESGTFADIIIRVTDDAAATDDLAAFTLEVTAAAAAGITAVDTKESLNNASPTFSSVSFGDEHADRVLLIHIHVHSGGSAITAMTVGGDSATRLIDNGNTALFAIAKPTGTSGNIVATVTSGGATTDASISVLRMVGFSSTASDTDKGLAGASNMTKPIDCPAGGIIVAGCYSDDQNGINWTNVDVLTNYANDTNQKINSTAARVYASAQTNLNITAANSVEGAANFYMVVASFAAL